MLVIVHAHAHSIDASRHTPINVNITCLSNAMTSILGLGIHCWIPVRVKKHDTISTSQIHTQPTTSCGQYETKYTWVAIKLVHKELWKRKTYQASQRAAITFSQLDRACILSIIICCEAMKCISKTSLVSFELVLSHPISSRSIRDNSEILLECPTSETFVWKLRPYINKMMHRHSNNCSWKVGAVTIASTTKQ